MTAPGIVLVHGYSGRPEDLAPVRRLLAEQYGEYAIRIVRLPGHADGNIPAFDAVLFGQLIDDTVLGFRKENRRIVLLGHSTGGTLLLDHLQRTKKAPELLILAGTPALIQGSDLDRWERHRGNRPEIPLPSVARMVSCVNRLGNAPVEMIFPVLILQGGADPLVRPSQVKVWRNDRFPGAVRCVVIPGAGHDLFSGPGSQTALDCVRRALGDLESKAGLAERTAAGQLQAVDGDVAAFLSVRPHSTGHLVSSPASSRALGHPVRLEPVVETDPIQLNIEITSRCNLACRHCARSLHRSRPGKDMDAALFESLLDLLPNTFKVVLVGLGEPTLHPGLVDFVALAAQRGHRVGLVTNAMSLEKSLSRRLVSAGLGGLTVSLDSAEADLAAQARPGSDIGVIIANIKDFVQVAGGKFPTAVFTAVSAQTVHRLPSLAATVADLGIKAWMLTDLNFQWNQSESLWWNWTREHRQSIGRAVRLAFSHALPVLSVRGIEEVGLARRYGDFLITAPADLGRRSKTRKWCLSPWQTLPVDVEGNVTICDCRPHVSLGNLMDTSFAGIWNGDAMQSHRRAMCSEAPPADCLACPRF